MKKRLFKRAISLLFVLVMLITVPSVAFAVSQEDTGIVARASYFCYVKNPGHCWIYVENLTDETFTVGIYELEPYGGVSVGTFGYSRSDGFGIYYNVEAYAQTTYGLGKYTTNTEELTREELETLSNAINSYKNNWNIFKNCTSFAANVWNSISGKKMRPLVFPAFVRVLMVLRGCSTDTPVMKPVTKDRVYRQIGSGSGAYLKNVSDASLGDIT